MKYLVEGTINFDIQLEVHAENEEAAKALAKNHLSDYYRLDVHGADHDPGSVKIDLDIFEEEDQDDE